MLGEVQREHEFYKSRNLQNSKSLASDCSRVNDTRVADYQQNDQVNVILEGRDDSNLNAIKIRFIRCSPKTTVTHLKKFVARNILNRIDAYKEVF